ncbi:MAG TPA: ABC transporter ATP-binding protein [Chloroflexota bacterium]|nr:ABC transporter ATP-binding protein [Chloroflexota bacterium]
MEARHAAHREPDATPLVRVVEATKIYPTRDGLLCALDRVSLDLRRGEFLAIVGPSGCGKSTLLLLIAGLIPLTSGRIYIDGVPVDRPYTELGIVFQDAVLFEWRRVLDNLMLPIEIRGLDRRRYRARAEELLALVGLEGFARKYPHELSGGMRQRVALCRALIHDPPLLLMDEPFGALDALTRDQLNLDLQSLWQQQRKTVLFITHSIEEAVFLADRVAVMSPRPGRIEAMLDIELPRPRTFDLRETPAFGRYTREIRRCFEAQGVLQGMVTAGRASASRE